MTRMAEIISAKVRRLAGMKKRSDGIALDDARRKREGYRQQSDARRAESRIRSRNHPPP
ncbi:hypothetical protein [Streptomyces sp. NPDC014623]|uniref:hypothetical protein n=1 Tax=Streptomyces sp. NPDC014623 TaxID=3364875 RepID=UPI0036F83A47